MVNAERTSTAGLDMVAARFADMNPVARGYAQRLAWRIRLDLEQYHAASLDDLARIISHEGFPQDEFDRISARLAKLANVTETGEAPKVDWTRAEIIGSVRAPHKIISIAGSLSSGEVAVTYRISPKGDWWYTSGLVSPKTRQSMQLTVSDKTQSLQLLGVTRQEELVMLHRSPKREWHEVLLYNHVTGRSHRISRINSPDDYAFSVSSECILRHVKRRENDAELIDRSGKRKKLSISPIPGELIWDVSPAGYVVSLMSNRVVLRHPQTGEIQAVTDCSNGRGKQLPDGRIILLDANRAHCWDPITHTRVDLAIDLENVYNFSVGCNPGYPDQLAFLQRFASGYAVVIVDGITGAIIHVIESHEDSNGVGFTVGCDGNILLHIDDAIAIIGQPEDDL